MHCEYRDVELWYQSNVGGILTVIVLMWTLMALSVANSVFGHCDNASHRSVHSGKGSLLSSSSSSCGINGSSGAINSNYIYRRGVLVL